MPKTFVTTVVGSMPKPAWLMEQLPLNAEGKQVHGKGADWLFSGDLLESARDDATRLTVHDQVRAGIDVVSDGEQRRSSYITYITSRLRRIRLRDIGEKSGPATSGGWRKWDDASARFVGRAQCLRKMPHSCWLKPTCR